MIELKFTGICEDCPKADLELKYLELSSFNHEPKKIWTVECIHFEACLRAKTLNGGKTEGAKE